MTITTNRRQLFDPGHVEVGGRAAGIARRYEIDVDELVARHLAGDWGDAVAQDVEANRRGLLDGGRLLSIYGQGTAHKLYVLTEPETNECERCATGHGTCEPRKGRWFGGRHLRPDLKPRRLRTLILARVGLEEYLRHNPPRDSR